ncbi:MAG: hypothetical protein SPI06_10065 [Terrisporobacter sp.]|uniref:hypothetical protein n=1 Tax=Terrisporobacter sp. TaxID=1965305 RepID=UPI002A912BF9|nr:hypothetical protein [Terrisporobacter sp.]MDY6153750.1 hypothetical protein [Terrisporobacter sp.]
MNRKQMRKQKKLVQKRVGKDGLKMLLDESNNELVRKEVKRQTSVYQNILLDAIIAAMQQNRISDTRIQKILDEAADITDKKYNDIKEVKNEEKISK